ncbi:methyl-accepting chemotaxis protein [Bosea beijingensis]|uniref:methyl-accepting chemotaxis protein n=1 Tax=Bosea beijingensis TaxID=3068632 RepID=UPI002741CC06|nr:methyl-accepting chemotaxis protein [Bosea sp. REN20]
MSSLKHRFAVLCLFLAAITGAAAIIGIYTSREMGATIDEIANSATSIRNHTIGDMLHDGMRADVYAALIRSAAGKDGAETIEQVQEHAKEFREKIAATKSLVRSEDSANRLRTLDEPLEQYISQALDIVALAFRDRAAALAAMPRFDDRFKALEVSMKTVGDALEAEALKAQAEASTARQFANIAAIGGLVIAIATALGLFATVLLSVVRPVSGIVQAMRGLGATGASADIPHTGRRDEIGEMARAIGSFQSSLHERAATDRRRAEDELAAVEHQRLSTAETARQIQTVVEAAARGDFSRRVDTRLAEGEMAALVVGINRINEAIDDATTKFATILTAIAGGDLTRVAADDYSGRLADLSGSINEMVGKLSQTVSVIKETATDVRLSASEIQTGAENLSHRTESQASSLEETAATTEELAASVKASAHASHRALNLAREATQVAESGGGIVKNAIDAMSRIEQASGKITDITSVIDNIAFQTNLLALNAAVEAARAGEAGKGFAVVASEVRTLAQQTADAAKSISSLIAHSTHEVANGVELVRNAGEALGAIVGASQKVASTIAEISSASGEQANGIDEMSQTVAHMDEMTQQNAALAEQSAASAILLSQKIEQLDTLVAAFRTANDGERVATPGKTAWLRAG